MSRVFVMSHSSLILTRAAVSFFSVGSMKREGRCRRSGGGREGHRRDRERRCGISGRGRTGVPGGRHGIQ